MQVVQPRINDSLEEIIDPSFVDGEIWDGYAMHGEGAADAAVNVKILGSNLRDMRLTGVGLPGLKMRDCRIERCEISGGIFDNAQFARVEFVSCRLSGVVIANAQLRNTRFADCRLESAQFRMTNIERCEFVECQIPSSDFYEAELDTVSFLDCDLSSADFSQARMDTVRLHGSEITDIRGGAALSGSIIDSSQITSMALVTFDTLGIRVDDRRG
ncbi:MAG: pentapeptide repeat-containing protein [Actinomycetota bacterium]